MPTSRKERQAPVSTNGTEDAFVGRRRELKAIRRSLEAAATGEGRLEIVSGAPGIGKTRLAHEVATIARARGFYVLRGQCWEGEGAPAYWPWADILRNHLGATPDKPLEHTTDLGQLLQAAASCADTSTQTPVDLRKDAQQARLLLFDRFYRFLVDAAAHEPVLVVLDDLHWADIGSLLLLKSLAGRLSKLPIVLLVTSREPLSEMVASISRHASARQIVLRGLILTEARTLLAMRGLGPTVLERLMSLTDGNPYFLKELGHLLIAIDLCIRNATLRAKKGARPSA